LLSVTVLTKHRHLLASSMCEMPIYWECSYRRDAHPTPLLPAGHAWAPPRNLGRRWIRCVPASRRERWPLLLGLFRPSVRPQTRARQYCRLGV